MSTTLANLTRSASFADASTHEVLAGQNLGRTSVQGQMSLLCRAPENRIFPKKAHCVPIAAAAVQVRLVARRQSGYNRGTRLALLPYCSSPSRIPVRRILVTSALPTPMVRSTSAIWWSICKPTFGSGSRSSWAMTADISVPTIPTVQRS